MLPVKTERSNVVYRGPTPDIGDAWCERVAPGQIRVALELDDEERAEIADGGLIELAFYTEPIPPFSVVAVPHDMYESIERTRFKIEDEPPPTSGPGWPE